MTPFAEIFARVLGVPARMSAEGNLIDKFPEELRQEFADSLAYFPEYGYDAGKVDKSVVQPGDVSSYLSKIE